LYMYTYKKTSTIEDKNQDIINDEKRIRKPQETSNRTKTVY
jgi:hypothetical protein